ncbi:MAG: hypothetical protein EPN74_01190 [Rhodanobacter sp.]|nr:MAG: hypothetical protein EPN74_01190 [Rhodanobacter sp.]
MIHTYKYVPHVRIAQRREQGPPTVKRAAALLHGGAAVARLNRRVGLGITTSVGTMWCAYAFAAIALVSLPAALASGDPIVIVAWIAQTFLQLVLLPVIIVGQNIQAAAADARSAATYEDAGAILEEARGIQAHLATQDGAIAMLLDKLATMETALGKAK